MSPSLKAKKSKHDSYINMTAPTYRSYTKYSHHVEIEGSWEKQHFSIKLLSEIAKGWLEMKKNGDQGFGFKF